ncbi:3-phosphoshikimate 1-carboxyvinyltransferase [Clostridium facile]|uniref:3-phosphoshikimate 1-carboxyvinyltransferase n=1 Tax=Clostridium facile TaxID=2763035 RepID=A0ABR7INA3_9CLOT|nr:3-phosphoshikimate 1-carboxyvinyltransferase [Clostridium facile]MBC5786615.1 3-phosphoshikimate 1-carboxyvinyltransferase [Clostridium facile]
MQVVFSPSQLDGKITIPPSKSLSHRAILSAALANGTSKIENIILSKDIVATLDAVKALGATYTISGNTVTVTGIQSLAEQATIDCCESGSTLRFFIPIVSSLGVSGTFLGKGKLPTRPITPYLTEMSKNGVVFDYHNTMPFSVSGQLQPGDYQIDGDISSQFVTGLLFALPLLNGESQIHINGKLESKPYADMTIDVLQQFGIQVMETEYGYRIPGNQSYHPHDYRVEGDFSQAAFFAVAAAGKGSVLLQDLNLDSSQGDKEILTIIKSCGAKVEQKEDGILISATQALKPFEVDASDIPDLVPILGVLGSICQGKSWITGAKRLKIKESDRLKAISDCLNTLGGKLTPYEDKLEIDGVDSFHSGNVDSFNDHRIAMSTAIAALFSDGQVQLNTAESVQKSYPEFYQDYQSLGGIVNVIHMESNH